MAKKGFLDGYKTYDTAKGFGSPEKWHEAFKSRMSSEEAETILQQKALSPYDILCITKGASQAEIKKAFRKLIAVWHPDRNPERLAEAEEKSKELIAAYTILKTK